MSFQEFTVLDFCTVISSTFSLMRSKFCGRFLTHVLFRIVIILGISLLSESYQTGICIKLELLNTEYGHFIAYLRSLFSWHCPLQIFCFFLDPKTRCSADWRGFYLSKRHWYVSRFQRKFFSRERLTFGLFSGFSWKLRHEQKAIPQTRYVGSAFFPRCRIEESC